jgi:hypothetical protein
MRVEAAGSPLAGAERCEVIGMNRGQIVEKILDIKREKGRLFSWWARCSAR